MEVERKGYQKFDETLLRKVAVDYVESVTRQGMACCEHTCNNIAMNQFGRQYPLRAGFGVAGDHCLSSSNRSSCPRVRM